MESIDWITQNSLNMTPDINNLLVNHKFTNNIDMKIEELESYYVNKMNEIKHTYETQNINNIYINKNSLEILQKEVEIVKLISKYSLQNNKLEYIFIIICLKYLHILSEILRNRLKQPIIILNKNIKTSGIIRCSYKFCNYKEECIYNYSKKDNSCYQDHYVHNMVSHDVNSLIEYIEANYKTNSQIMHNKEILKTINTLSFVVTHMESELKAKCLYNDMKDCEKFHYVNKLN